MLSDNPEYCWKCSSLPWREPTDCPRWSLCFVSCYLRSAIVR